MTYRLRYYGDPVLRRKAEPVKAIDDAIITLAEALVACMLKYKGIGLAAPQIGVPLRLFATQVYPDRAAGQPTFGKPYVLINPNLSDPSANYEEAEEGCLSIPGLYTGPVKRPHQITFSAIDIKGEPIHEVNAGFLARHRMHEVDHLNGVFYVDRMPKPQKKMLEPTLRRIAQNYSN